MLALTDHQLELVHNALRPLISEKQRADFLKLLNDALKIRDVDVLDACERASAAVGTASAERQPPQTSDDPSVAFHRVDGTTT